MPDMTPRPSAACLKAPSSLPMRRKSLSLFLSIIEPSQTAPSHAQH